MLNEQDNTHLQTLALHILCPHGDDLYRVCLQLSVVSWSMPGTQLGRFAKFHFLPSNTCRQCRLRMEYR